MKHLKHLYRDKRERKRIGRERRRWRGKEMMSDLFTQSDTCISHVLPGASARCVCACVIPPSTLLPAFHCTLCVCVAAPREKASSHPPPPIGLVVQERAVGWRQDKFAVNTEPVNVASKYWR